MLAFAAIFGIALLVFGGMGGKNTDALPSDDEYAERLKAELSRLCSSVKGVSECEIAVTLQSGFVYEYDSRGQKTGVLYPRVCGVAVVCKGGEVPLIKKEITDLISAVLGISSTQISVSGK